MKKIHKGCGGEIVSHKCTRCGATWGRVKYGFNVGISHRDEKSFDPHEYRQRIRRGDDIHQK